MISTPCQWKYIVADNVLKATYHPVPWRDSISRPIAPVSTVAGGDDITRRRADVELIHHHFIRKKQNQKDFEYNFHNIKMPLGATFTYLFKIYHLR
jgi:hypothetical protein